MEPLITSGTSSMNASTGLLAMLQFRQYYGQPKEPSEFGLYRKALMYLTTRHRRPTETDLRKRASPACSAAQGRR